MQTVHKNIFVSERSLSIKTEFMLTRPRLQFFFCLELKLESQHISYVWCSFMYIAFWGMTKRVWYSNKLRLFFIHTDCTHWPHTLSTYCPGQRDDARQPVHAIAPGRPPRPPRLALRLPRPRLAASTAPWRRRITNTDAFADISTASGEISLLSVVYFYIINLNKPL